VPTFYFITVDQQYKIAYQYELYNRWPWMTLKGDYVSNVSHTRLWGFFSAV